MKSRHFSYWNVGPGLTITFVCLLVLILGGNGLLLWQFHMARSKSEALVEVSQQLIAVLRLQESLLAVHQRLDELARDQDAGRLIGEVEPLRRRLLDQVQSAKYTLVQLPAEIRIDPGFLPTLQTIETTLPSQLDAITALAMSGDWEAVRFRVANELKPQETQSSALVSSIDQQVSEDWRQTIARMESAQRRVLLIVPISAISTFIIAFISARTVTRRLVELRLEERVEERTRIAREFHDTLLQTVQGSKLVVDHALKNPKDHTRMIRAVEQLSIWLGEASEQGAPHSTPCVRRPRRPTTLPKPFGGPLRNVERRLKWTVLFPWQATVRTCARWSVMRSTELAMRLSAMPAHTHAELGWK